MFSPLVQVVSGTTLVPIDVWQSPTATTKPNEEYPLGKSYRFSQSRRVSNQWQERIRGVE
jgi:hypothetical protein